MRVYVPWLFVLSQQKFGVTDIKPLGGSRLSEDRPCYSSEVSNRPCYSSIYLDDSRKIHLWGIRAHRSKDVKIAPLHGREREGRGLWLLFLHVSLSLGLSYVNWSVVCFTWGSRSLRPSFVLFSRAFPSRSFSHRHFGLFFPILTT